MAEPGTTRARRRHDKHRAFRDAQRPYGHQPVPLTPQDISALARPAHAAPSHAFLAAESQRTGAALRHLVRTMSDSQGALDDDPPPDPAGKHWPDLSEQIAVALRDLEDAARQELKASSTQ